MTAPLPLPPHIPPDKLEELLRTMRTLRDDLLTVSMLLHEHLFQTDTAGREQARQLADALIRESRKD